MQALKLIFRNEIPQLRSKSRSKLEKVDPGAVRVVGQEHGEANDSEKGDGQRRESSPRLCRRRHDQDEILKELRKLESSGEDLGTLDQVASKADCTRFQLKAGTEAGEIARQIISRSKKR